GPVEVHYKLAVLDPLAGYKAGAYHVLEWSADPARLAMALLHELGHALHHAVALRDPAASRSKAATQAWPPGFADPADEHPHVYVGHGQEGAHCSGGLTDPQRAEADYAAALCAKKLHGTCIMWGGSPETVNEAFCEHCLRFLKADSWVVVDGQGSLELQQP